jgi:tRNA (guanine37-N1)-methyltransferase
MPLRFDLFTLFPDICAAYLQESILKRAQEANLVHVHLHNLRDYATDKHHVTDDLPYGGGGGMVMKPEPIFNAVESVLKSEVQSPKSEVEEQESGVRSQEPEAGSGKSEVQSLKSKVWSQEPEAESPSSFVLRPSSSVLRPPSSVPIILLTPQGRVFTQSVAQELAAHEHIALICGRYEGFDERVRLHLATDEISIGDYVLTGGELAALVVVDAVTRLLPGVLGDPTGALDDSHASGLLEYPHYTRPPEFRGWTVPDVLVSGDHARVARWRREEALRRTFLRRPDMLSRIDLSNEDKAFLARLAETAGNPKADD